MADTDEEYFSNDVFLVIPFIILCITGSILNLHALLIYPLRFAVSNHQILIIILSSLNMTGCCLCIPLEIVLSLSYNQVCKPTRFLAHVVGIASGFMLAVIALDRHRKICKPYRSQMNKRHIRLLSGIVIILSFLLSIPAAIVYVPVKIKSPGFPRNVMMDCKRDEKFKYMNVYFGFIFLVSVTVLIVCIVCYSMIIRTIFNQKRQFKLKRQSLFRNGNGLEKSSSDAEIKHYKAERSFTGGDSSSYSESKRNNINVSLNLPSAQNNNEDIIRTDSVSQFKGNSNARKILNQVEVYDDPLSGYANKSSAASRVTFLKKRGNPMTRAMRLATMFLVASVLSILWYFPQILFAALRFAGGDVYPDVKAALGIGKKIMENMYYISYVTTPLVYCFMDDKFRIECRLAYVNIFDRLKKIKGSFC
ncbi:hypothetical protein FSP39_007887 [Pinctada imbricata]|uniref:G-protein coupled receptors family 1 profile domain-containing protein n=1 Tax=Pinctada imbricata TaxID=66713 RepID=A0AA88XZQ5_PINIB|nr:hypothetical protein FSP39_007887 [Pinctada imbricata]